MPGEITYGRKRPLPACPNPLFLKWLTEWRDSAAEKNLKTQFVYQKAISSLKKYPLPLNSGKEAKILQNFGDSICKMLDDRLEKHYAECGEYMVVLNASSCDWAKKKKTGGKKQREYVPQRRSGGYAVLLTLYRDTKSPSSRGYMTKAELQKEAQPLCDKSFTLTDPNSKYTAWTSVSTLIQKELVIKTHSPARYSLTEKGLELAQRLEEAEDQGRADGFPRQVQASSNEEEEQEEAESETNPYIHGAAHRKQELVTELRRNGVNFDVRKLHIGDFLWIAQEKVQPVPGQLRIPQARELVLDYVVERKRMDDLCGSIIDGRFREQKFRLKRCGLRRPIYLVEDHGSAQHLSIPETTLQQAIVNTQVVDGFFIKRTKDVRESAAYLTIMTRYLQGIYSWKCDRSLRPDASSCILVEFKDFNEGAMKNKAQTVKEVFARQLMQISGVSGEKAAAILEKYSTPASLMSAYESCSSAEEKEKLLSSVKCGKLQRNLGPVLSKTISQLYCTKEPLS
uniref:Crossover junction endonuclease MUS81 n=1 Tax=Xenopus tropicalis TaxID=8364 RepID=F7DUM7_XENTR